MRFVIAFSFLFSSATLASEQQLQTILDRIRIDHDVPGISALVISGNKVVFAGGSGVADIESNRPATANTVYYIGSITKVLTAVLTLHLVEQSELKLSDRVTGIADASSDDAETISIDHLLTHTSGLEREGDFDYWFTGEFPDRAALSKYLSTARLRSKPGSELHYSNIGFAALGETVRSATGLSYDAALQKYVLAPLQMVATGSPGPATGVALGYSPTGRLIPDESRPFAGVGRRVGGRNIRMYHNARAMTPAFGAYSTARDLGRLASFLLGYGNDNVLSLAAREKMRRRHQTGRGLGIGVERIGDRKLLTHGGWFAAHRSQLLIDTTNEIVVIVLTNSDSARPRRIADALHRALLGDESLSK